MLNRKSFASLFSNQAFELPFFIFLTLVLLGMSAWSVISSPAAREPARLVPFCLLMLVHISLYWVAVRVTNSPAWIIGYLLVQGLLAFAVNLIINNLAMILGLYMGLIGITVGMLKLSRQGLVMLVYFFGLSFVSYGLNMGWQDIGWWALAVLPMSVFVIIYVTLYNRQTEARAEAQALLVELEDANRRLAEYANRVEELTLANERQRMARELHDTLSQGLAGLILKLEAVDAHLASARTGRAQAIVQQAMEQARTTLAEARRAIGDLREPSQEREAAEVLRREAAHFSDATGIPCKLTLDLPAALPPALCETLRRAVSEGLTNIARHAQAGQAEVSVSVTSGWLEVVIRDDGIGFDPANADREGHYGLLGMRERARLAHGSLEVISRPGRGATLKLRLPLQAAPSPTPDEEN